MSNLFKETLQFATSRERLDNNSLSSDELYKLKELTEGQKEKNGVSGNDKIEKIEEDEEYER